MIGRDATVHIGRVVLDGGPWGHLDSDRLQGLIQEQISQQLRDDSSLGPVASADRIVVAAPREATSHHGEHGAARAIGEGVSQALRGGGPHG